MLSALPPFCVFQVKDAVTRLFALQRSMLAQRAIRREDFGPLVDQNSEVIETPTTYVMPLRAAYVFVAICIFGTFGKRQYRRTILAHFFVSPAVTVVIHRITQSRITQFALDLGLSGPPAGRGGLSRTPDNPPKLRIQALVGLLLGEVNALAMPATGEAGEAAHAFLARALAQPALPARWAALEGTTAELGAKVGRNRETTVNSPR